MSDLEEVIARLEARLDEAIRARQKKEKEKGARNLQVLVSESMHKQLRVIAAQRGVSVANIVRDAIAARIGARSASEPL